MELKFDKVVAESLTHTVSANRTEEIFLLNADVEGGGCILSVNNMNLTEGPQ